MGLLAIEHLDLFKLLQEFLSATIDGGLALRQCKGSYRRQFLDQIAIV